MSDAVDGRSAARCRSTIVRQNDTFLTDLTQPGLRHVLRLFTFVPFPDFRSDPDRIFRNYDLIARHGVIHRKTSSIFRRYRKKWSTGAVGGLGCGAAPREELFSCLLYILDSLERVLRSHFEDIQSSW
eukprot:1526113-Prymnesium_polylepis.1